MKRISSGYTLLEILVVMSIMAIIFGIGYANFRGYSKNKELTKVSGDVMADIRLTQALATEGKRPLSGCGTKVLDNYTFIVDSDRTYRIEAHCLDSTVVYKSVTLPSGYTFQTPLPPAIGYKVLGHGTTVGYGTSVTFTINGLEAGVTTAVHVNDSGCVATDNTCQTAVPTPTAMPTATATATPVGATATPTSTGTPTPTPTPTVAACTDTVCYQDFDGDGYRSSTNSMTVCVPLGDCSFSTTDYNLPVTATVDCNDTHIGGNKCCWTIKGACDGSCKTGISKSTKSEKTCANSTYCAAGTSSYDCYSGGSACSTDGTGTCEKAGNYDTSGPHYSACSQPPCSLYNRIGACNESKSACAWSW